MKLFIILLLLFSYINIIKSQLIHGASLETGIVSLNGLSNPFNNTNIIANRNIRSYNRYDWSIMRVYLRSNESEFTGYINIHPRVDEFTTYRIPNTQKLIFKELKSKNSSNNDGSDSGIITGGGNGINRWPGWQIWVELPVKKNITTFRSEILVLPCENNGTRINVTECSTPINGTLPASYNSTVVTNSTQTIPLTLSPKNIIDVNTNTFVNYFAIVVQLDKGNIIDAMWDGDRLPEICKSCDSCIDNQCGVNYEEMHCETDLGQKDINGTDSGRNSTTNNFNNGCQVKLQVAFAGRDYNNRPCQSINKLPSNFQKYSATSIKKIGTGLLSDFFYKINSNNNNPNRA